MGTYNKWLNSENIAKWKNPVTIDHILYDSINMIGKWLLTKMELLLGWLRGFKIDCDDGYTAL